MAVSIKFWQFAKKENSTKKPETDGTAYSCLLKEPVNLMNPIITLQHDNPVGYNYAYINTFGRYYFVTNWTYERGLWCAELRVDVLASWKAEIGESTQYVLRSSNTWDSLIVDNYYPMNGTITHQQTTAENQWSSALNAGSYIVGIVNSDANNQGAISYYSFTDAQFKVLCGYLLGDPSSYLAIDEISDNLQKALFNPLQYVVSCKWFPFRVDGVKITTLKFGWWEFSNCECFRLSATKKVFIYNFDIPRHPQAVIRGGFCNLSPYSKYTLFFQCWGTIPLDNSFLSTTASFSCSTNVDLVSGIGILRILSHESTEIAQYPANVGVDIQLAQINNNPLQIGVTAVNTVASVATSFFGGLTGVAQSVANGIASVADATRPQLQVSGANGSTIAFLFEPTLTAEFFNLAEEDVEEHGKPLCSRVKLNTIPGYILCGNAHISITCTVTEQNEIIRYLNGGVHYE